MAKATNETLGKPTPIKVEDTTEQPIDREVLRSMIAEAAYLKAEKRGFAAGCEMEDWVEAEKEILEKFPSQVGDEYRRALTESSTSDPRGSQE
jgi:hypothetical protein